MKYFKRLEGERIYLSPIHPDDYEIYAKWLNDERINQYLAVHNRYVTVNSEKEFIEYTQKDKSSFVFGIINKENDQLMGNIGLHDLEYKDGTCELGIFIGDVENLGKGYGSEAIRLILRFAFQELRLHNVMLKTHAYNERALKAYIKCGFKEIGRRHEAIFHDGKYYDMVYMEVVNS